MGGKFFVALQLEVAHHFIETCAWGRTGGFELPATFRATKTHKTLLLNPIQLPAHALCRCSLLSDCTLVSARRQGTERPLQRRTASMQKKTVNQSWPAERYKSNGQSLHEPICMVCRASYIDGKCFVRTKVQFPSRFGVKRNRFKR